MIRNYIKVALRSLIKQKVYTLINVLGLSVGIASCLLITMFVIEEFSYDKFLTDADRIYKVVLERKYPNHSTNYAFIPHSYSEVMGRDFAEVEDVVKVSGPINNVVVNYTDRNSEVKQFEENFVMAADSNFFSFFSLKLIKGNSKTVLTKLNDIVLTQETANRYFGQDDPVGKTLKIFNQDFNVTGICENLPDNSHLKFDFLSKWNDQFFGGPKVNFITFSAHTYIKLKPGANAAALEAKFPKMVDTYASAQIEQDLGKSWADYKREGNGYRYFLQPLTSIHLDPTNLEGTMRPGGNRNYVYFLICIASLILAIACINFMNLATARSAERAREVGVRKTMGSLKGQLVYQFLVESVLLSLFATVLALGLAQLALPYFNALAGKHLSLPFTPGILGGLLLISVVVGFMAGSYPAFALSSINPIVVMKGHFASQAKGSWLRNGLVVFQFFISIVLIVGTLTVVKQMNYMENKSLGYDKEQVLVIDRAFALNNKVQTFIEEMKRVPGVVSAGGTFSLLGRQGDFFGAQFTPEGSSEILTTKSMGIDDDFAQTIGFEFVAGRGYSKETNDSLSIILNETAVKTMGLSDPVGKKLKQILRRPQGNAEVVFTIIGVIKDFNFQSLRDPITPLTIQSVESFGGGAGYVTVRLNQRDARSVVSAAEEKWKTLAPDQPFKYLFLDQNLHAQYAAEQQAGNVFAVFSGLAIVIACVGLFGLAAYTANLRTKEIGVRKVMGASVFSVVILLSKEFTKLIVVAFVLSVPFSWFIMDRWLEGFAFRVDLGVGVFLLAGGLALLISWITVSYQSIRAAIVNPIKSLRSE
ncbi:putative ABC transport system permease protein [Chryseolinea serpens]|uniref:Putative ABC transport system permease protein n=1 Tax=Chryseolinea serpens TaxID=947013 RepID=A0A1M5WG13_9BACT|nr:ABC transporter permease [Chryseolinea serpens]SHH86432.1 putative ABC transport system permease protein [Chryseolinea serpens]